MKNKHKFRANSASGKLAVMINAGATKEQLLARAKELDVTPGIIDWVRKRMNKPRPRRQKGGQKLRKKWTRKAATLPPTIIEMIVHNGPNRTRFFACAHCYGQITSEVLDRGADSLPA